MKDNFQDRVAPWMQNCFGEKISADKTERNHRFLEESLELVQACGCTKEDAILLVDYVFDRPIGKLYQEIGGVMITLAALCLANKLDMDECGEIELKRIWKKIDQIRQKQKSKPRHSPLPEINENNQMTDQKLYAKRIVHNGGEIMRLFLLHSSAMTSEDLHSKSDIAAELAFRDEKINRLSGIIDEIERIVDQYPRNNLLNVISMTIKHGVPPSD